MSPLRALFSTEIFMPRGHDVLWTPALLILEAVANLTIAAAAGRDRLALAPRPRGAIAPARGGVRSFCSEFSWQSRIYSTCG